MINQREDLTLISRFVENTLLVSLGDCSNYHLYYFHLFKFIIKYSIMFLEFHYFKNNMKKYYIHGVKKTSFKHESVPFK
jgi:hypothetical protein